MNQNKYKLLHDNKDVEVNDIIIDYCWSGRYPTFSLWRVITVFSDKFIAGDILVRVSLLLSYSNYKIVTQSYTVNMRLVPDNYKYDNDDDDDDWYLYLIYREI